jgi:hypothetical protein
MEGGIARPEELAMMAAGSVILITMLEITEKAFSSKNPRFRRV